MKNTSVPEFIDIENYEIDDIILESDDEDFAEFIARENKESAARAKKLSEMLSKVDKDEFKKAVRSHFGIDD